VITPGDHPGTPAPPVKPAGPAPSAPRRRRKETIPRTLAPAPSPPGHSRKAEKERQERRRFGHPHVGSRHVPKQLVEWRGGVNRVPEQEGVGVRNHGPRGTNRAALRLIRHVREAEGSRVRLNRIEQAEGVKAIDRDPEHGLQLVQGRTQQVVKGEREGIEPLLLSGGKTKSQGRQPEQRKVWHEERLGARL